jgi:hypothetical protein
VPALSVPPLLGTYVGLQTTMRSMNVNGSTSFTLNADQQFALFGHLDEASRSFERDTQRRFYPVVGTNLYRWPPYQIGATWSLYVEEDLLSVTLLQTAVSGQNALPITISNYFLEPQPFGPPYNRIEIDISSTDAYQSGPTPQRSVSVTGLWGYTNATVSAGTETGLTTTGVTTLVPSIPSLIDTGDVLLVDSEAMYVSAGGGTNNLTVQRGVNGTVAATHTDSTAINKYRAPAPVSRIVMQQAIAGYLEEQKAYLPQAFGSNEGGGTPMGSAHAQLLDKRMEVIEQFERARTAAI